MVLAFVLAWNSIRFWFRDLAFLPEPFGDKRPLPILHGCMDWHDPSVLGGYPVCLQGRYFADAGKNRTVLGWRLSASLALDFGDLSDYHRRDYHPFLVALASDAAAVWFLKPER